MMFAQDTIAPVGARSGSCPRESTSVHLNCLNLNLNVNPRHPASPIAFCQVQVIYQSTTRVVASSLACG